MNVFEIRRYYDLKNKLFDTCVERNFEDARIHIHCMTDISGMVVGEIAQDPVNGDFWEVIHKEMTEEEFNGLDEFLDWEENGCYGRHCNDTYKAALEKNPEPVYVRKITQSEMEEYIKKNGSPSVTKEN